MKILICYDEETNELWYYIPEPGGYSLLVQPRTKKEKEDDEDDDKCDIH